MRTIGAVTTPTSVFNASDEGRFSRPASTRAVFADGRNFTSITDIPLVEALTFTGSRIPSKSTDVHANLRTPLTYR